MAKLVEKKAPQPEKKPYQAPEVSDYGTVAQQTLTHPHGAGGTDYGSS